MNQELVSLIVPIYKVEMYLDQCVSSIVNQTYQKLEIILVDDGSPDHCPEMCDEWAKKDSRIRIIHKQNGGLSDARNAGIEVCQGEYLAFIDSDDWIETDYVEKMLQTAQNENADIVACTFVDEYEATGKTVFKPKERFVGDSEQALLMLYDGTRIAAAAMKLYRHRIWKDMRFPVGRLYEDALTTYKAFDLADRIAQIPDGLYHYRIREGSIMTSKFSLKTVGISDVWKENYLFCKENYPRVADTARSFWLVHIPSLIQQFPKMMTDEDKAEKKRLKKEISDNMGFIVSKMPIKKKVYMVRALCFQ